MSQSVRAARGARGGRARTIVDILSDRSRGQAGEKVFTYLRPGSPARSLTFGELHRRARAIAARLAGEGLRGRQVLLLYPPGTDFIEAFLGCLAAGVVAVPAYPLRAGRALERLASIAADSGAEVALSPASAIERSRGIASPNESLSSLRWIATDEIIAGPDAAHDPGALAADSLAYLQYTSGSTSEPKGVMISHANLLANSEEIREGFGHDRESRSLTWLPHFHDMGLVDGLLQPIYSGFPAVLMDPTSFLQNPARWLEAISEHGITHTGAPNFAYELCLRRVEPDPERFDLRSWAVAYNGAEPVRAETLDRFAERFAPCGFRREAFYPAYGLAEATLKVSGEERGRGPAIVRLDREALESGRARDDAGGLALVGAGRSSGRTRIRIVDPEGARALPENEVGEIWVQGPGVALGYWKRAGETRRTFRAELPGESSTFLRTGDLGFLREGRLFVTGRAKDLIIIRGRNVYPQDVEGTAAGTGAALRPGGGAAFGVERGGSERLVLVQEVERRAGQDPAELLPAIRRSIVETHEIDPAAVVLVRAGGVPRTTSGKVRRAACRDAFLQGTLPVVAAWHAPEPGEAGSPAAAGDPAAWLRAAVASKVGVDAQSIPLDQPAIALGLDSLRSVELAHEIETIFGVTLRAAELLAAPSLASIAARLDSPREPVGKAAGPPAPGEVPLSAGQKALWFLHELEPDSSAYTIASALRLSGPLDESLLEQSLRAVVARHPSLRARVVRRPEGPCQRFDVPFETIFSRGDLRGVEGDWLARALAAEAHRPFDLEKGPLLRITLFRADGGSILLFSVHHAVADLWSLSVVIGDLVRFHGAPLGAEPPGTSRAPHPAEFVRWQETMLQEEGERLLSQWRRRLGGEPPPLDLPADRPRPQSQTFHGSAVWRPLDPELAGAARTLAREAGVTMYTVLLAAFQAYLCRITGQPDVLVGTPASGRTVPRFSEMVGYLVNAVVMRGDLSGDPSFTEFLQATRESVREALEAQDYPFSLLVKRLGVKRDPSRSPLFDVMFDLHSTGDRIRGDLSMPAGGGSIELGGGVTGEPVPVERRASQFDLSLTAVDDGTGLQLELEFNTDLFEREGAEDLLASFERFLGAAVSTPAARVSRLALVPENLRGAALESANSRPGIVEDQPPVHRLFEREAGRNPRAPALWIDGRRLTYGDLNRRANGLARRLRALEVGQETRVALCLDKSFELLTAILAVLKAGGVYVPIPPSLPASRKEFMLSDCGASVIVTGGGSDPESSPAGIPVIRLDEGAWTREGAGGGESEENLPDEPGPGALAYIIYTSGTTGLPKGVGVTHQGLSSAYRAWESVFGLRSLSTHLQMASPGFDVFAGDMVRALCSGASLVLCPRETLLDPPALAALIRRHGVDCAEFVPATLRELAGHLARTGTSLESLRLVAVGSDVWSMADYALFKEAFGPGTRILNTYGVTEATIDSAAGDAGEGISWRPSPAIGRPLPNSALHVLDEYLEPLPAMVRGELYIGGPAVARGYVGRPGLTAERFVPDPHGPPGARLYRTGDLARRLRDGAVELIGRADTQVKVRGYRIEPSEVEDVLSAHPSVRSCAVVARPFGSDRRLAAYVVLDEAAPGSAEKLRAHAAARLPEYMIPAAFVVLPALPITPNGKIDRRALPEPEWASPVAAEENAAPASPAEKLLHRIWAGVLGIPDPPRNANFFELGGDSILSIQVVARAREAGLHVTPRMIFEHPSLADLALACGSGEAGAASPAWTGEADLAPIQRWFFDQEFAGADHWNMAAALETAVPLDADATRRACSALLDHHDALRARFRREGTSWIQTIASPGSCRPRIENEEALPGEDREAAVTRCARRLDLALDIRNGPVIAFGLVRGEEREWTTLVIVAHHLVMDGVSLRLIAEDFERAYRLAEAGGPIALPGRTAATGRWAQALEEATRRGRFEEDLEHWRRFAGRPVDRLPILRAGSRPEEGTTRQVEVGLAGQETRDLLDAAVASGRRVEQVILAAVAHSCARWTGSRELAVEMEGHGRDALDEVDLSRTVGWFTQTYPVLIEGIDSSSVHAALEAVSRAARPASSASFGSLLHLSSDPRVRAMLESIGTPPISFNYLGSFDAVAGDSKLFTHLREPAGSRRSERARRTHAIEIDASISGGRLSIRWSYSPQELDEAIAERLASGSVEALTAFSAAAAPRSEDVEEILPVTPMQEGMLFHHLRSEDADPYVGQLALELAGDIDFDRMARAWEKAVARHAALRTAFAWEDDGRPVQKVFSEVTLPVTLHEDGAPRLDDVMEAARRGGFDTGRAPLARVDLVRTGNQAMTVVFTHHHLLLDGWSLPFVIDAVFEAYESPESAPPSRPAPGFSMRPYVEWMADQDPAIAERYFRRRLEGISSTTPAPGAGEEGEKPDREGSGLLLEPAPADVERRARALGLTPSTVVQAAWGLVLAAEAGRRDVVFGATSSGRPPEVEGIETAVGLFINTLPMRLKIDPDKTALSWMREVQKLGADLRRYEHASLAEVQRWASLPPETPLFETLLVFENYPLDVAALGKREGFSVSGLRLHEETNYPLTIVASSEEGLRFRAIYDRSRFTESSARRVLARLHTAIEALLDRPQASLRDISVVPEEERALVVGRFNETMSGYPRDATISRVFESVARSRSDETALVFDGGTMSYGELAERAAAFARALRDRGVKRESRVALAMDRSPDLIVAILGVLRAGGAYVPLDPEAPRSRWEAMLACAGATLLVGDGRREAPPGSFDSLSFRELMDEGGASRSPIPDIAGPDNLAYVMFTSGSTGEPKGIEVSHGNILKLVLGADYVRFGPGESTLLLSSVAFDGSTFEIYAPLLHGGQVAIPPGGAPSTAELRRFLERFDVTTMFITSGLFHVMVDEEAETFARVRQVITGGDIVSPDHARRLMEAGCPRLVIAYGPTETTTFATCGELSAVDARGERLPIGKPISNTRAYVLDDRWRPVPLGASGELFIGGDGVARGYAGRPGLTAERFVPDPFGLPGARMYATGDIVRWRADGRLDFIGRRDRQVKVRGFRVEVDDVETALSSMPGVRAAAVAARREEGVVELVGYVVPDKEGPPDAATVRRSLAERVPRYMIPSRLVFLDALPLNTSGKIDRRALPAPSAEPAEPGEIGPMSATEEKVAGIWRSVLGLDRLGPEEDFFEAGGHSLHATRVVARLRRAFGVEIPLRALFEAPTVRRLAAHLEEARRASGPPLLPAAPEERRKSSYAQSRLWFLDRLEPGSAAYNIAGALRMEGELDAGALSRALSHVVGRHEALRTRFEEGPDGPVQIVDPPEPLVVPLEDLRGLPLDRREPEAMRRVAATAREPFDLSRGPLLRARLLKLGPEEHVIVLAMHHIASDGWSMGVLVEELAAGYASFARGEEPDLAPLGVQYADWAAWQRGWLEAGEMDRQLAWWKEALEGVQPLTLPADRPRPARPTYAGDELPAGLDARLVKKIEKLAQAEGATLHMALTAAFGAVLGRWSGQEDVAIGTPVANRTREEAEPLVGCFVNTLVVRAATRRGRLPFRELLAQVRESALGAYANQDVPFERVVEAVQPRRDLSRTPLFQVMLVLNEAPVGKLDLGGMRLSRFDAPTGTSTFDLTLTLEPVESASESPAFGAGLDGSIEYSTELFDEATVRRLRDHLVRLLEAIAEDPGVDVHAVRLANSEERGLALDRWSGRDVLIAPGPPVHERFASRAAADPSRIAAVLEGRRVTYGDLRERAARIAAILAERGVGPETRVGLCAERSPELLAGMMGILEAGGAFVPLDPDHPGERLAFSLADSGARIVLATERGAAALESAPAGGGEIDVIPIDGDLAEAPQAVVRRCSTDQLAYVIYTSGTTGRPKGVMVSHGSLSAAYEAWERLYGLDRMRTHLQMAGVAFDVCTGDAVRALCSGGTLVFCERERLLDPARLFELARDEKIEFAEFVPAVLRQLASHARERGERLDTARIIAVGSDVWTSSEIGDFGAVFGSETRLANSYGVTEATIDSTCWFAEVSGARSASPPIGSPLAHSTVYVLDESLEPAPPGVAGDLYIGGPGVARGYEGRPDLTAERFVPDPFGGPGDRLYRTGDRARYLSDGAIAFAGRSDDQLKIRGQRIEPAEIESALAALEPVAGCAVAARPDVRGVPRLAAWIVERAPGSFDPAAARNLLRDRLPEAMIPSAFVVLPALPLTPNGKVDRRRLPEPDWEAGRADEPPSTPAEAAVAEAFADVLGLERVGAGDDFFALGGHSLLATRVVSRLRAVLGVEVPLRLVFEAPCVRDLASLVEGPGGVEDAAPAPPLVRAGEEERRLLSYSQQRLWFLDRLEPDTPAYNLPSSILLEGELDLAALRKALAEVVRRHESLRTLYREGAGGPVQVVAPAGPVSMELQDLSDLDPDRRREAAQELARHEARKPFDLEEGPVFRVQLQRFSPRRHALVVTVHHIAADGWSLVILMRDLGTLYGAFARGEESPLPEPELQYADWSAWQRRWLEGGELERQLAWWRSELHELPTLELPFDRPRPVRRTWTGGSFDVVWEASLRDDLDQLARRDGATLHMALLAGYAATLGRWSGQNDFAVGTPIANRRAAEAENLIGFCVNTLAIRARLHGRSLTFRELIGRLREAALGAQANQDAPFERVVEELQPERRHGHSPLFQVLFALQNFPIGKIELPGLSWSYEEPQTSVTRFDIELFFAESAKGLEGLINYSEELFDRVTIERFVENMACFLRAAVQEPDRPIAELPSMSPVQRYRALVEWNAGREEWDDSPVVHAAFERHAEERPEAIAARIGDARITYGELDARAGRLARLLRRRGVGAEDRVAVCVERSFDMLVALLGTLKAGAAYLPIDPEYPEDRIALIFDDAGARAVLTTEGLAGRLPLDGMRTIRLDQELDDGALDADPAPAGVPSPDALVYTIYTSGSTGRPKGIAMTHRAISNLLSWQRRDSRIRGALRTLQFASLSFDVSFQEIFSTLTAGGEIVLVTEEQRRDPVELLRLVRRTGIERLFVPFVALDQLAEGARSEGIYPDCLREINTAGEQLRITSAIASFFERLPGCRLVNHYGPSETHLVTTYLLDQDSSGWPELPSIGRPITNVPVYLLDDAGRPVPIGATGEIHVGGAGLARGYQGRPDLTAGSFVPDPFSGEPGARMYRTGDLARFDSSGSLTFLGRRDLQVKVRGYRVEPGEIEACLARHPAVRAAAVRAHDHAGGKRLAAFVVLEPGVEATPAGLKEHIGRSLPDYMVPSAIVVLDSLPLTSSGKVDRNALPEPDWEAGAARRAPRTPEEEIVCGILAEVLGAGSVGADDDFFELGGHSLLATQVISRVRRAFGAEVPLRAVFESPTATGIAAAALAARGGASVPPPVRPAPASKRKELSLPQRRLWFLDRLEPGSHVYNIPAALRLEGDLDVESLRRALEAILLRHESLRTRFVEGGEGPEQVVDPPGFIDLDVEESGIGAADAQALHELLTQEAERPFDLSRGPVLRVRLFRLGPETHVLSLVAHHIVADGWSLGILVRELGELYGSFREGREPGLALPAIQYADWAAWQREWLEGGELNRQLEWWRESLAGAPPALDLPADRARPAAPSWRGATLPVDLPAALRAGLEGLARAEGATLHMVLLAGYAWTLMQRGGQREIVIGTPVANRRAAEAEELVGFFVNTLAVRVRGEGRHLTFRELLAQVRDACLGAYAHQDVPFERVVEEIQPERVLNRAPIFQTAFALQNATIPAADLPGLTLKPIDVETNTSKFDLMLVLQEEADRLSGAFEYSTDLYDRTTMDEIFRCMRSILEAAVEAPGAALAGIRLVGDEEEQRILSSWSAVQTKIDVVPLVHHLFERQADLTPRAPALAGDGGEISYQRLEEEANRIAHHLISLGTGPDERVALLLPRSPRAITAMLGVLKAGCAYVPIEPGEPVERLRRLIARSGARVLITEGDLASGVTEAAPHTVALDGDASAIASASTQRPRDRACPRNLAYVIFTSGSTGEPKGVGVEHRQIASYAAAAIERLGIEPGCRFALMSTVGADLGLTGIFASLGTGGCLHVPPADLVVDAEGMEEYIAGNGIDVLKIVPSHMQALLSGPHPERIMPARLLVLGGEATPGARLPILSRLRPECLVANHYGPTETTVGAVAGFPESEDSGRGGMPLGRPLGGYRAYVLDEAGRPAPAGVAGEIFLAGNGVARGYVGRPDLTAERFVPDPFAGEEGARMYRTGDRGRWLRDGRLEFLGRVDEQVKVRGFRVEPGEVQAVLERDPRVRAAAVVARPDPSGGARLVAYVAPRPRRSPVLNGRKRRTLPLGISVAELNRNETDYIQREIFELGAYVRHGVTLRDGDTVIDVGANIGLFTIFANLACRSPRVLAVEPNPHLEPILRANLAAYAANSSLLGHALSDREGLASFTFFEGFSLLSGLHADAGTEKEVVKSFLENQARSGVEGAEALSREADELLAERFGTSTFDVRLRTLSDVIAEHEIRCIDLLKINAEKAELEVLRGLAPGDWARISQAVVEVDLAEHLDSVVGLFESNDFDVHVDQDPLLRSTELRYVYAARRGSGRRLDPGAPPSVTIPRLDEPLLTTEELRALAARELPGPMQPSAWVVMESLPVTPNGKLDRRRLPEPQAPASHVAPRGDLERAIAAIWAELLGLPEVGAHDNFFDLGGHSLLLTRTHARLRATLEADLSVVDLFRYPTVAALAGRLAGKTREAGDESHQARGRKRRAAAGRQKARRSGRLPEEGPGEPERPSHTRRRP